jgi:hypothetical protein
MLWVLSNVLLQRAVPDAFRGRVFAAELVALVNRAVARSRGTDAASRSITGRSRRGRWRSSSARRCGFPPRSGISSRAKAFDETSAIPSSVFEGLISTRLGRLRARMRRRIHHDLGDIVAGQLPVVVSCAWRG